jgi:hypothetical protein
MNKQLSEVKILKKRGRKKKIITTNLPSSLNINLDDDFNILDIVKSDTLSDDISSNLENNDILIKKNENINERLKTLNIIFNMYPSLRKDKDNIINNILEKKENKYEAYVVEKIDGLSFNAYIDEYCNIIDSNLNLIGITSKLKDKYYFFDDIKMTFDRINKITNLSYV